MKTDQLFSVLSLHHPVDGPFREALGRALTPLSLPRNFMLVESPRVSENLYFLVEGFAISYTYSGGKQQVDWLWKPGDLIVSPDSFFGRLPSREFIQLRVDSELFCIDHWRVMELFQEFREADLIYRSMISRCFGQLRDRTRDLGRLRAFDRYRKLLEEYPSVEQYITQEQIASYLGIKPQSFSRLKRRHR